MLKIYISDDECDEGETWQFLIPLETSWSDIQTAVRLLYPTTTCVTIEVVAKEE